MLLLAVLVISYRQVIEAFPNGGGAYAVAKAHLGVRPSLIAAASLVVDYILNAAVGVSAGVEALTSAFQPLYPDRVWLCLAVLGAITAANLWGVAESARLFIAPTIIFIAGDLRRHHRRPGALASAAVPAGVGVVDRDDRGHPAPAEGIRLRQRRADRSRGDRERGTRVPASRGHGGPSTPRSGSASSWA